MKNTTIKFLAFAFMFVLGSAVSLFAMGRVDAGSRGNSGDSYNGSTSTSPDRDVETTSPDSDVLVTENPVDGSQGGGAAAASNSSRAGASRSGRDNSASSSTSASASSSARNNTANTQSVSRNYLNAGRSSIFSWGGGVFFSGLYGSTTYERSSDKIKNNYSSGGFTAFFDAKYVEIDLDVLFASRSYPEMETSYSFTSLGFLLMGKYPVAINSSFTAFPLVGIDWQFALSGEDYHYNMFAIGIGGGADYAINKSLFIRGEVLINFKSIKDGESYSSFYAGPRLKAAVGYKL